MGGGDSYGASLSASSASGASDSGAVGVDVRGGGNFGGQSIGPGSLVQPIGAGASLSGNGIGWPVLLVAGLGIIAALYVWKKVSA